jgi:hypothetical protein
VNSTATTPRADESAISGGRSRHRAAPPLRNQPRRNRRRRITPREEVTMMKRLRRVLRLGWQPALKDKTLFNGQLLDQKREDVYVVLHQMGVIR